MRTLLRERPIVNSVLAIVIAAVAVLLIARLTGAGALGRVFGNLDARWIWLVAVAQLLTYPAYMLAYRSLAQAHGHAPPSLPTVARIVVAGFGPFALAGGFGIDKQALQALDEDERSARVRVIALGTLEWAVLAPLTCVVSIVLLIEGAHVAPTLLWPWALAVPLGFLVALWAAEPARAKRLTRIRGRERDRLAQPLEGIRLLRTMAVRPWEYAGAWTGTALYWAFDICAFYGALRTFGLHLGGGETIIAYGTGYAATRRSLPLGGAGLTEGLMTYAVYLIHERLAPALAAVLVYRAFSFLLIAVPAVIARRQLEPVLSAREPARSAELEPVLSAPEPAPPAADG